MIKIKKSVSLSLFEADKSSPILFMGDIEKNIPKIKELGYDGVDLFVLDPKAEISLRAKQLLKENDLGVGVVMPAAMAKAGLFLGDTKKEVREEIVSRMKDIIIFSSEIGAMVSLGLVRGSVKGDDTYESFFDRFATTTQILCEFADKYNVKLLIEPINRYEINTLNSSEQAFEFINRYDLPLYLMLDTFHMNIEDVSITESLKRCQKLIKHIHFLDSNRLAPGMGHLNMVEIYNTLKEINYNGFLCLEALAQPNSVACAEKGIEFFKKINLV